MRPSVGRIVHFSSHGEGKCQAAIVTTVTDDTTVGLTVFAPFSLPFIQDVTLNENGQAGTWHWPEQV